MATASLLIFIPLFFICLAASLAFVVLMAIWLYKDSRLHGQDPVLWVLICIFASPIIALILYLAFGRKQTLLPCQSCQAPIPHTAQYCEHCGAANEQYGQPLPHRKMNGFLKGAIATGAVSLLSVVFMFVALFAFAMSAGGGSQVTGSASVPIHGASVTVNSGWALVSIENHDNGVWNFTLNKSSNGYHLDSAFTLDDPSTRTLMASAECTGGPLLLNISQDGQLVESIDLSRAESQPVAIPLDGCTAGTVSLQLVNEGATNISGSIWVE
ncbi:zinc ribbon domain-containing protein [Allofournierella massiliensis]|uniref:Zinc ribbon domain-containing protein n=1 Tax=Allofournierella massiliensis TaxID=1650663 RepID=A0ABT7UPF4_9FIRM|nr:zinc ribbon domain-containing protein [Fournierella massiliensis]MDM8200769.1 zinc ribbon domain-containing protein [Fournierella massiliensis]